jgi:hypothetical protein
VADPTIAKLNDEEWREDAPGIRARECFGLDGKRFAIVEYAAGAARVDWCVEGHYGLVLEGRIRYLFADGRPPLEAGAGEGFFLSHDSGHQGHNDAGTATRLFLVDPV